MDFQEFAEAVVKLLAHHGVTTPLTTVLNGNEWKEDFDNDLSPEQSVDAVLHAF